jgi:mannose-6-phosphate isomerase-like protein (cupin superfamily)
MNKIDKPWGHEVIWAKTDRYVGKMLVIEPNQKLSLQYDEKKEETIFVLEGMLQVWDTDNDNEYKLYGTGSAFQVTPNQVHRFGAGDEKVKLIEVSSPEIEDIVELSDDYSC